MLILDMQEEAELESPRTEPEAADERARGPEHHPAPALQLQEYPQPVPQDPHPELVRRTLAHWSS
jgi:hypothetical protein